MDNNNPHKGVQCLDCKVRLFSKHRHDFKYCNCRKVFVDGGTDYLRYGWEDKKPKVIELRLSDL